MPTLPQSDKQRWQQNFTSGDHSKPRHRNGREDELVNNILPSYHMFQSTVCTTLTPSDENYRVDPPMYEMTPVSSANMTPCSKSPAQTPVYTEHAVESFPFPASNAASNSELNASTSATNASSSTLNAAPNASSSAALTASSSAPPELRNTPPGTLNSHPTSTSLGSTFNDQSADIWENTVLANAHKLPNLSDTDNDLSKNIDIGITVTDTVCQVGVAPTIIDPSEYEYKQGDYIHGYVTIRNNTSHPMPFDMVYVVFEGSLVVLDNNSGLIDGQRPATVHKFLNMLDLFASWSYANIARLVTDDGDPHDWCPGETDPYDGTALSIDVKRFFQPNVTYKRFFTFRIPDKLLDDSCEVHNFTKHTEVPPSIGFQRNTSTIPHMYLTNTEKKERKLKDLSFIDTYINYSVDARIIGKASEFNHKPTTPGPFRDQYVIAKERSCPIRVIPVSYSSGYYDEFTVARNEQVSLFYRAFVDSIKNKIAHGTELLANQSNSSAGLATANSHNEGEPSSDELGNTATIVRSTDSLSLTPYTSSSSNRLKQLYSVVDNTTKANFKKQFKYLDIGRSDNNISGINDEDYDDDMYQCLTPIKKKKTLTGSSKIMGVMSLSTPKQDYRSLYVPPAKYRSWNQKYDTTLSIPIELAYFYEHDSGHTGAKHEPPEIKSINCELVALTLRSKKNYIPVEFNHEMCFKDKIILDQGSVDNANIFSGTNSPASRTEMDTNNFEHIVIKPMQEYFKQTTELIKKLGDDSAFRVENSIFKDLKALAFLQSKNIHLTIDDVKLCRQSATQCEVHKKMSSVPWDHSKSSINSNYSIFSKKISLELDLSTCHAKGTPPAKPGSSCFDQFTLVPSFQTCLMARLYYVKIEAKLANGTLLAVHVPLTIEN